MYGRFLAFILENNQPKHLPLLLPLKNNNKKKNHKAEDILDFKFQYLTATNFISYMYLRIFKYDFMECYVTNNIKYWREQKQLHPTCICNREVQ